MKVAKNQANAKQHPEAELLLFESFHILHPHFYPKLLQHILKNKQKNNYVCIHEVILLMIMKMKMKMKNRSHRYDINGPRSRHGSKYSKYKNCLGMIMF